MGRALGVVASVAALIAGAALARTTGGAEATPPQAVTAAPTPAAQQATSPSTTEPATSGSSKKAATPTKPTLTVLGKDPRIATFNYSDSRGRLARVGLLVKATVKGGALTVTFASTADGQTYPLSQANSSPFPSTHSTVFAEGTTTPSIEAEGTVPIALRLGIARGAPVTAAAGLVRIALKDEPSVAAEALIEGADPKVSVSPNPVKIRVTRWLGPVSNIDGLQDDAIARREGQVAVVGPGAAAVAAWPGTPSAQLHSDRNGNLTADLTFRALTPAPTPREGEAYGQVSVERVDMTGKYGGAITVDPAAATPTQVPVEVEAQDAFLWPLAVLLLSAGLGGWLILWFNLRRRRSLLQTAMTAAVERYRAAKATLPQMYALDPDLFGSPDGPLWPSRAAEDPGDWGAIDRAYHQAELAATDDEFTAVSAEVGEVLAAFDRWHRVAAQFEAMKAVLHASHLPPGDPARADADHLLTSGGIDPETEADTDKLIQGLHGQRLVLAPYSDLVEKWNKLDRRRQASVPGADPTKIYTPIGKRAEGGTRELLVLIAEAIAQVEDARRKPPPPRLYGTRLTEQLDVVAIRSAPQRPILPAAEGPPPVAPAHVRPAHEILGNIRRWDCVIAITTIVISAIAYLLPTYASHTFGSWEDYLRLAVFGFLGSTVTGGLVLNWQLFPSLRSYQPAIGKPKPPPKPPKPAASPAG